MTSNFERLKILGQRLEVGIVTWMACKHEYFEAWGEPRHQGKMAIHHITSQDNISNDEIIRQNLQADNRLMSEMTYSRLQIDINDIATTWWRMEILFLQINIFGDARKRNVDRKILGCVPIDLSIYVRWLDFAYCTRLLQTFVISIQQELISRMFAISYLLNC